MTTHRSPQENQLTRTYGPEVRSEFMRACLFVGPAYHVEPSTLYSYRWPGSLVAWDAYLAAVRLVCDAHFMGDSAVTFLVTGEDRQHAILSAMRRKRRRGFSLRQYKQWRAAP